MGSRLESKSNAVRKRIENHNFENENGEEYDASSFGGFPEYFRRKKIKLQNLDAELRARSGDKPQIFKGVVVHVNGYTQPSLNDLHGLIVSHGGGFIQYLDGKTMVTHIVASSLTPKKAVEFRRYRIVKPAWIVDSIETGRLLPWDAYRVVDEGASQQILGFENGKVTSHKNDRQRGYRDQTDTSWYTTQLKQSEHPVVAIPAKLPEVDDSAGPSRGIEPSESSPRPCSSDDEYEGADEGISQLFETAETPGDHREAAKSPEHPGIEHQNDLLTEEKEITRGKQSPQAIHSPSGGLNDTIEPTSVRKRARDEYEMSPSKRAKMTAEEHNALLLADPHYRKSSAVNPQFLEQFYKESRLHHLSIWKADLKAKFQAMATEKTASQKSRPKWRAGTRRYIFHVDFDCFFATVSLKKYPQYIGEPVGVAHGAGPSSELASCNYEARKFGVKNGMWMKRAMELCPELKVVPYDFQAYEQVSEAFYKSMIASDGILQSVSIDEALIDVTTEVLQAADSDGGASDPGCMYREQAEADRIALVLRNAVRSETDCEVSIGIGGNILLAKVALRKAKPAGQYQIRPDDVLDFLSDLTVRDLPGVAWSIGGKLQEIGVTYVKDLRDVPKEKLIRTMGPKTGERLWEHARGIDRTEVGDQAIRKSVSAEVSWGIRFETQEQADEFIGSLCGELSRRLIKERLCGRNLTLKVMKRAADAPLDAIKHLGHGKCDSFSKSVHLGFATNDKEQIAKEILNMMRSFNFSPGELRGLGIQMTKLELLKSTTSGEAKSSSQRKIQFKTADQSRASDPPIDKTEDPITDDVVTPQKPKSTASLALGPPQLLTSSPSRKPLNTLGTQFILPTQVDSSVLSELPPDIRSRLSRRNGPDSRTASNRNDKLDAALPTASQLDPSILAALPEEIQAELRIHYENQGNSSDASLADGPVPPTPKKIKKIAEQSLLPQSPRKTRSSSKATGSIGPRKRGRPPGPSRAKFDPSATTLTQSFLISSKQKVSTTKGSTTDGAGSRPGSADGPSEDDGNGDDISPEFLAALPEDIRAEVVREHASRRALADQQRRRREVHLHQQQKMRHGHDQRDQLPSGSKTRMRTVTLPARAKNPTFTSSKLRSPAELRNAVREWVEEFKDEGPYREDVEALGMYLQKVATDERDLAKVVKVVQWWSWCVDDVLESPSSGGDMEGGPLAKSRQRWERAEKKLRDMVQESVKARGLGQISFG